MATDVIALNQPVLRWTARAKTIPDVEKELSRIWAKQDLTTEVDGVPGRHVAARTNVMNLVVIARRPEIAERGAATIQALTGLHPSRTIVVQRGPSGVDPFTLKYDGSQWSAEMPNAAVNPSTWWRAKSDAVANKWTHLVATYDAGARILKLTVGYQDSPDMLKSTVTGVVGWSSTGVLSVGRSSAKSWSVRAA